ncbi:MAG: aminotransferase class I/II-fold pyridoxal phosphate-dependent enzyme [Actinomycetota bacterium]|nr:aminotransferase class I/II-fold pyridoxal phosphate-dependent enzyme [Actinomycetota bacterium]
MEPHDPLGLDAETMRQLGYRTVDALVESLTSAAPPLRRATPEEMQQRLAGDPPEEPQSFDEILEQLNDHVLPFRSRVDHPAFFGFIPGAGTWPGALGDFIASASNVYAGSWMESAGPSQAELEVLGWFKRWIGYPAGAAGSLTSGGSAANLTALACARERVAGGMSDRLVIYASDQAHSSVARAARLLGFGSEQLRVLPADSEFRLAPETLAAAIDADVRAGRKPLLVAANGGTTNTGAVDPLPALSAICDEHGLWLHVDAAYGGFAALTERGRDALAGLELADSVVLDPHKWLYQPFECGCLLVRDGESLRAAFEISPTYLKDSESRGAEVNFSDLGIQLTRSSRALKLWVSLRYFGIGAFRRAIDRTLDLAEAARRRVETSDALELMAPPALGVLCFRRRFAGLDEDGLARANARLVAALEASGLGLVSSTRLRERYAIRMCILNHTSGSDDVERVLDFLERTEIDPDAPEPGPEYDRHPDVRRAWVGVPATRQTRGVTPASIAGVTLFQGLDAEETALVAGLAQTRDVAAGTTVVEQWDVERDFFVVLDGKAEVILDGELVNELGPGDFFGELAALDWGAGFGYPRLASVVAVSALRLLVFPDGTLNVLVRRLPPVERKVHAAVRKRIERDS